MAPSKTGVWTNVEDEILKVCVSKYGPNQWARVSSLQPRKTAKQCKARWQEWLDPTIKKTEWSREEDEKLLHLAKVMPTQWRTIASRVGRTATQSLERYQQLLDEAEAREAGADEPTGPDEFGLTGVDDGSAAPTADSVRRLRPGESDPNPESRPARPDTIDMDEDEKEMLSEARARLANTQGKKAKRKARERQLEKSKMMANLQKWREMKEAGIAIARKPLKKGQMDYNADIPFEHRPTQGFHDTTDEINRNEKQKEGFDPRNRTITTKRKGEDESSDDRKRRKDDKAAHAAQVAQQAAKLQKLREAEQSSKRRSLVLPAPQVGDTEMDQIVKMSAAGVRAGREAGEDGATGGLVGNYTAMVDATPIRTPQVAPEADRIAAEAQFARMSEATQSALLGGNNTPMMQSNTVRASDLRTPNPLATPLHGGQSAGPHATPVATPRDSFGLNYGNRGPKSLGDKFAALPAPKDTEWELELPEEQAEVARSDQKVVLEDAAVREARERAAAKLAKEAELARQSTVIQRGLPRPAVVDVAAVESLISSRDNWGAGAGEDGEFERDALSGAMAEIGKEMARLMASDARRFGQRVVGSASPVTAFSEAQLKSAAAEIRAAAPDTDPTVGELVSAMSARPCLPGLEAYGEDEDEEEDDAAAREASRTRAFWDVHARVLALAGECNQLEQKLAFRLGGYMSRQAKLAAQLRTKAAELADRERQLAVWRELRPVNEHAGERRLAEWRGMVAAVRRREREAQELYRARAEV